MRIPVDKEVIGRLDNKVLNTLQLLCTSVYGIYARARAYVRAYVRTCMRACVRAGMHTCVTTTCLLMTDILDSIPHKSFELLSRCQVLHSLRLAKSKDLLLLQQNALGDRYT